MAVLPPNPRQLLPVCATSAGPSPYLDLFGLSSTAGCASRLRDTRMYQALLLLRHARGRVTATGLQTDRERVLLPTNALQRCRMRFLHPEDQRATAPLLMAGGHIRQPFDVKFDQLPSGGLATEQSRCVKPKAARALANLVLVQTRPLREQGASDPAFVQLREDAVLGDCPIKRFFPDLRTSKQKPRCFTKLIPELSGIPSAFKGESTFSQWETASLRRHVASALFGSPESTHSAHQSHSHALLQA